MGARPRDSARMGSELRKPLQRRGKRNIFCPFYGECLDEAVKRCWTHWSCSGCVHRLDHGAEPERPGNVNYSIAYYEVVKS